MNNSAHKFPQATWLSTNKNKSMSRCTLLSREKEIKSFDSKCKHSGMPMMLPNPEDRDLFFLVTENHTIQPHESEQLIQQINNKNRGLTSFFDCLTPVMSSGVMRWANGRQTGWPTLN